MSSDRINARPLVVTAVPGTDGRNVGADFPHSVRVPPDDSGLPRETVFLCFQARALDPSRFTSAPAGMLTPAGMAAVAAALRYAFEL